MVKMDPGADYRERIYRSYVETMPKPDVSPGRAAYLREVVSRFFPADRDARILDLGCGSGDLIDAARKAGYASLSGVDGSPQQVERAQRNGVSGVSAGDLRQTIAQAAPGSYDFVVMMDVLEHFAKDEVLAICDGIFRMLSKGGAWLIHVPNGESPLVGRVLYGDFTHQTAFTHASLRQVAMTAGFSSLDCHEDIIAVHGAKSALRAAAWRTMRLVWRGIVVAESGPGPFFVSQNLLAVARR